LKDSGFILQRGNILNKYSITSTSSLILLPMVKDTAPAEAGEPTAEPQVTYASGRVEQQGQADSPPDLRLIHYNDVYHLDPSSAEPVGGLPRFISVCREYQEGEQFKDQPKALTLFSGDVFNPSLESTVTKGEFYNPGMMAFICRY
jgi:5'-nucleotidase